MDMPAQYMFKDLPGTGERDDYIPCTRGVDQVLCASYFPMGLSLDRIFRELPDVPLRDEVWPKFLRENAVRVFKLES